MTPRASLALMLLLSGALLAQDAARAQPPHPGIPPATQAGTPAGAPPGAPSGAPPGALSGADTQPGIAAGAGCGTPAELLESAAPLPALAGAVAAGQLRILALGGASVLGPGTSGPAAAWPARLAALLAARRPGLRLEVAARGRRGLTTAETAALLAEELARTPTQLVIWVTGTVDAVRGLEVDEMVEALNEGLDRARTAGVDVLLVDPQFSRFLRANANVEPYVGALRLAAAAHGVPLLRRWDLMRYWAENDIVDVERAAKADRVAATDRLNDCLAQALLALLRDGAGQARRAGR